VCSRTLLPGLRSTFQLKSGRSWNLRKVVDAYDAMLRAIRSDNTPNLFLLQYSAEWLVNLVLVPKVFFSESVIEQPRPLSPHARRAGWIGCNILFSQIPQDGKIAVVLMGAAVPNKTVRREFARVPKPSPRLRFPSALSSLSLPVRSAKPQVAAFPGTYICMYSAVFTSFPQWFPAEHYSGKSWRTRARPELAEGTPAAHVEWQSAFHPLDPWRRSCDKEVTAAPSPAPSRPRAC
jgi:Dam-replacing family